MDEKLMERAYFERVHTHCQTQPAADEITGFIWLSSYLELKAKVSYINNDMVRLNNMEYV